MVTSRPTMESRNEPEQQGAVSDASRMGLGLRGAMRMCETARVTADEPSDPRTSYLGKGDDPLLTRVYGDGGNGGDVNETMATRREEAEAELHVEAFTWSGLFRPASPLRTTPHTDCLNTTPCCPIAESILSLKISTMHVPGITVLASPDWQDHQIEIGPHMASHPMTCEMLKEGEGLRKLGGC